MRRSSLVPNVQCLHCGKRFYRSPSHILPSGVWCSNTCSRLSQHARHRPSPPLSPAWPVDTGAEEVYEKWRTLREFILERHGWEELSREVRRALAESG